jgi:hypothetical protein
MSNTKPKPPSPFAVIAGGLFIFVFLAVTGVIKPDTPEEKAAKAQAAAIERAEEERQERLEQPHTFCSFAWKEKFGNALHDPDSLDFDFSNKQIMVYKDPKKAHIGNVEVPYRAKNGFGGLVRKTAECDYDLKTGHITRVIR